MLIITATILSLLSLIAGITQGIKPDYMYWTNEINTAYERYQMEHFGNILPTHGEPELENGKDAADRCTDWMESQAQQQLMEHE